MAAARLRRYPFAEDTRAHRYREAGKSIHPARCGLQAPAVARLRPTALIES
jgi:hypothetical protein